MVSLISPQPRTHISFLSLKIYFLSLLAVCEAFGVHMALIHAGLLAVPSLLTMLQLTWCDIAVPIISKPITLIEGALWLKSG